MRRSKILGLRWSDINFDQMCLSVIQTLQEVKSGYEIQSTKNKHSKLLIDLDKHTIEELKKHQKHQKQEKIKEFQNKDLNLIAATSNGNFLSPRNLARTWYRLLKKSELPKIRFHNLRHTHATLMLEQGWHPKIVSERLGHSSITLTIDTYSHVIPSLQREAAKDFGEMLFGSIKKNWYTLVR